MAESMSDVCKRAVVPPVCFNKDCKCRIKIPSKVAVVGKDNELTEKDMHENFFNAAMTNKYGNKIDSGAIEKDFEYYDSKQLWFGLKNVGEKTLYQLQEETNMTSIQVTLNTKQFHVRTLSILSMPNPTWVDQHLPNMCLINWWM